MRSAGFLLLLAMLIIAIPPLTACSQTASPAQSSGGAQLDPEQVNAATQTRDPGEVEIVIWAPAFRQKHWRVDGPLMAAERVTDFKVKATAVDYDEGTAGNYPEEFALAAEAGEAPDIAFAGGGNVPGWAGAGYLVPLDECRARYPEFDQIMDSLWPLVTWEDQVWGIPLAIEVRPLFFSKLKLKELGWSDEQIAALPEQIEKGEFTLDDVITTSKEAIDRGLVKPGFGYWPSPYKDSDFFQTYAGYGGRQYDPDQDKLVVVKDALAQGYAFQRRVAQAGIRLDNFLGPVQSTWSNRLIYLDTVAHDRSLFWNGHLWDWPTWAADYVAHLGGRDYLFEAVGYALRPSGLKGKPGNTRAHLGIYVITSERASGRKNQDAACALLAKTVTPEINALHVAEGGKLGVLKSSASYMPYSQDRLTAETMYMRDYIWYGPKHARNRTYWDIVMDYMIKAENGEMAPSEAATAAVEQLQNELGDAIIVE